MAKSPVFDYDKGDFIIDGLGAVKIVEDAEAVAHVAVKALQTERGKYELYVNVVDPELSHKYGADIIDVVIRRGLPNDILMLELKNAVKEALIYDPEITAVSNITITLGNGEVEVSADLSTVYDKVLSIEGVLISG